MAMQELTIKRRTETGKEVAKRLRRAGAVPAVVYDGQKAETVTVDPKAVLRMIHGREGTTELLLHVDLQEVSADRAITVHVTVRPVGEAAGVREQKGILNLVLYELAISCLPTAIPERIDADVSALMIGDVLKVSDLQAPEGVRILNDPGQAVATVAPPMAEEVAAAAAPTAAAVTEPEVLTERKPKEGEEAAAAGDDKKPAARPARAEKDK